MLEPTQGRTNIFKIHASSMSVEKDIRYELLARLCSNSTGAENSSVCTEAVMFAIGPGGRVWTSLRHSWSLLNINTSQVVTEKDFLDKPKYMTYNYGVDVREIVGYVMKDPVYLNFITCLEEWSFQF